MLGDGAPLGMRDLSQKKRGKAFWSHCIASLSACGRHDAVRPRVNAERRNETEIVEKGVLRGFTCTGSALAILPATASLTTAFLLEICRAAIRDAANLGSAIFFSLGTARDALPTIAPSIVMPRNE